jgi:hypothetical protein
MLPMRACSARRTVAFGISALMLVATSHAFANGPVARLTVTQDPEISDCPSPEEIATAVDRIVGRHVIDASSTSTAPATIQLQIKGSDQEITASLRASGAGSGVRELKTTPGQGCAELSLALPLTLALIIDVIEVRIERDRLATRLQKERATPAQSAPSSAWKPTAEAGALAAFGVLHSTAPAFWGSLAVESPGKHSVGIGAFWAPQQTFDYAPGHVGISLWAVTVQACGSLARWRSLGLTACGGPMVGQIHGSGTGFSSDGEVSRTWAALEAEFGLRGGIWGALEWVVRGGGLATITSQGFTVDGVGVAQSPHRMAAFAGAGLRMSIW